MPEIRLEVPQSVIDAINDNLRQINGRSSTDKPLSANDVAREALAVYKWAVEQTNEGYAVVSANANRAPVVQIATPHLPAKVPTSL
jgi:hypothetical protein